ncbi:hypothetical protein SRCM100623_00738 [Acetobacter pasteurianus]|uniref:Uncharacterized protein n=1 Tax=Acetobacter pasteurianus TaxID=438 RepID=A0A1A0DFM5_ACEPA|nr:hypothetical protein SRCM100623_00738 [Acetobacter pasteurianus]GCD48781.1 hypothetical protein NBRC106471_0337 [Acetobacter pasteurianus subsp. pasteurianus LMG 1262 = NBRC 106471]
MIPDFECGMIVGGVGVFLATIILVMGWRLLVMRSGFWRGY